jgi:ribonuclease P protein component
MNGKRLDEANVSTESNSSETESRVSRADEFTWWPRDLEAAAGKGPEAPRGCDAVKVTMCLRTGRFERADRLLRWRDFQRLSRVGDQVVARPFVVLMASSDRASGGERPRLGVTVSRRVGNAVVRNRVKRAVREWFRRSRGSFERRLEIVVIARRGVKELSTREIWGVLNGIVSSRRGENQ